MPGLMSCAIQICPGSEGGALPSMRCGQSGGCVLLQKVRGAAGALTADIPGKGPGRQGMVRPFSYAGCGIWQDRSIDGEAPSKAFSLRCAFFYEEGVAHEVGRMRRTALFFCPLTKTEYLICLCVRNIRRGVAGFPCKGKPRYVPIEGSRIVPAGTAEHHLSEDVLL